MYVASYSALVPKDITKDRRLSPIGSQGPCMLKTSYLIFAMTLNKTTKMQMHFGLLGQQYQRTWP